MNRAHRTLVRPARPLASRGVGQPSEEQLLGALRAGQPMAFEAGVRTHTGPPLPTARRVPPPDEDARHVVQETFLAAFRSLGGFQGEARLSTWLHRIAVNSALMKLRARRCRPEAPGGDLLPVARPEDDGAICQERADVLYEQGQLRCRVRGCIDQLPAGYRAILLLRYVEDLDTQETARSLGISTDNAKIRLHRARLALRALLEQQPIHEEQAA